MDLFYKNQDMKTINSKIKSGNHPIYFFLFLYLSMVFAAPVGAQEVPIPAYQLKYWCDPYEYPLG